MRHVTPRRLPIQGPSRRAGQALLVVLLLMTVLSICVYALHSLMLGFRLQTHKLHANMGAQTLALSGLAAVSAHLKAALRTQTPLGQSLLNATERSGPVDVDISQEKALLLQDYPGASLEVQVHIGAGQTLMGKDPADAAEKARLQAGPGWDPREQRLPLTITAHAIWGSGEQTLSVTSEMAIVNLAPGTLGKFTLWASSLEPAGAFGFAGTFDGLAVPGQSQPKLPFVLHNAGASPEEPFSSDPDAYLKRGYVYLGNEPSLAMPAGYLGLGELWTFLPIEELSALPDSGRSDLPVFVDSAPPDFFLQTYPSPPGAPSSQYRFDLRHMVAGYYAGSDTKGRTLSSIFPTEAAAQGVSFGQSSLLRLFGTAELPSPTLVLGRVHRTYPLISAVLVDANDDGTMDGLVTLLPQLGDAGFPASLPAIPPSTTGFTPGDFAGTTIPIDNQGEVTWDAMFPTQTTGYEAFASTIEDRPYMEAYNFLYRTDDAAKSFYPTTPKFPGFVENFSLGTDPANLFFQGAAANLSAGDILEKATYRVATPDELAGRFISIAPDGRSELSLGAVVEVQSAPSGVLRLTNLTVTHGGALVLNAPGDIELSDVTFQDPLDFPLILVALYGNVRIIAPEQKTDPLRVSVFAPSGTLTVPTSSAANPLEIEGSIVVNTLDFAQFPQGGDLFYDTSLDPSRDAQVEPYRILLADAPTAW